MAKFPKNFASLTQIWLQIYKNYTIATKFLQNILFNNIVFKCVLCSSETFILINKN